MADCERGISKQGCEEQAPQGVGAGIDAGDRMKERRNKWHARMENAE
jgi:hypothetical protein